MKEAIDHGVSRGVPEDKGPPHRREDDHSGLHNSQTAEISDLLEEPSSVLGEGNLQGLLFFNFFDFDLLAAHSVLVLHVDNNERR